MIDSISPDKRPNYCDRQLNQKRQVKLKTCADVYEHWRSYKRLYKKAPHDGVEFHIDYIDTGLAMSEEERSRAPIALALHGAPGSYHDFSLLINHLASQRVRVIAPNFPEYIATVKTKVLFRHSADEKAAYLRDFLKAIGVRTIDLLVSHSSAIFPTLLILLNANQRAIERQNQTQRQVQEKTVNTIGTRVDSFSSVGNQLKKNIDANEHQLASSDQRSLSAASTSSGVSTSTAAASTPLNKNDDQDAGDKNESYGDNGETVNFVDALDQNNNDHSTGKRHKLVVELKQLNLDGTSREEQLTDDEGASEEKETKRKTRSKQGRRNINKQDVIVHFDEPIEIKSVALFNPAGHRLPKSMKPTWFKCGSVHVYQHKFGRSLFRKFGPAFLTVIGVPVRVDNMDNVMLSATVMRNSKCQRVVKQLEQLSEMRIPTLLVFSENDKLIEKEIFYEMTQFMRLDSTKFDVFNNDGDIELSQSMMDDWIRVMVFKAGGHYAYSNYARTVNKAVSELLAKVRPHQDSTETQ